MTDTTFCRLAVFPFYLPQNPWITNNGPPTAVTIFGDADTPNFRNVLCVFIRTGTAQSVY